MGFLMSAIFGGLPAAVAPADERGVATGTSALFAPDVGITAAGRAPDRGAAKGEVGRDGFVYGQGEKNDKCQQD